MWAVGTAVCYCHRFYAVKSMARNDRFVRGKGRRVGSFGTARDARGRC